ncbi:alpha-tocopherol transfer protein-like [Solenopsis invicta]|uniref:alpha-tocopherol transfer protein-like n=1 Tax=Solenopsis invicta TaxID=13686 RepID=UPI00193DF594|nr:alpha-tocopherol transfer protein-like [Solenopsis invicta]XP_039304657.1 alpha-tocopherol transfer protein-like [Solenopsis invicta]XP_039304658.1 alpha-tocopherol transfer protein-like [Solenopsis invicta]XP_039304659.1 alpha-tocopherol transfer protein-like [Solenopsis invicta]XP_039304661.1 alpha-tocopherol transfer protein-like [Solenopsis invicta]
MSLIKRITLEEEMEKSSELKLSDIQSLKEWCEKQPHLPKIEDSFLALFLHSNYYQMEQTKNTIENYYTIRTHVPEFFSNRDPLGNKELRQAFKIMTSFPLNGVTKDGYTMIYGTILDADPSHYNYNDVTKYSFMLLDVLFLTHGINNGYVNIVDVGKLSFGHVTRMSLSAAKKNTFYIQEAAPMRLKEFHIINAPPAMELLMNISRPLLKKELIDMIHVHSSLESLSKYIPLDALPNELGGKGGFIQELADNQIKLLEDYREWFLLDETTGRVNEALRINTPKKQSCCIT